MKNYISIKEIEYVKNISRKKAPASKNFISELYLISKGKNHTNSTQTLPENWRGMNFSPNSYFGIKITLIPKSLKDITRKENLSQHPPINKDTKIINKINSI